MNCHWDNPHVLEFIELLHNESSIWDPKKKPHKNRTSVNEAWERIKDEFSLECTVGDLKRKRNSLMTAYREHIRKIKDTSTSGLDLDDVYKPTWFAFEAMHSFLGPVYETTINTEEQTTSHLQHPSRESEKENDTVTTYKRKRSAHDLLLGRKPKEEPYIYVQDTHSHTHTDVNESTDENNLFLQMLAHKLKKMNERDRLMLTHDINNLVFEYEINARAKIKE